MACHLITRKIHLIILLAGVILSVPSIIHASTVTTPADSLQNLLKSVRTRSNGQSSTYIWRISMRTA